MRNLRSLIEKRKNARETANSLVLYVLWMPLMFGVFGVAVDSAVATYTVATLQSGLDTATQSALARSSNPGTGSNTTTKPSLTQAQARTYTINFYDANRSNGKNSFIHCQKNAISGTGSTTVKFITPPSGCGWTETSFSYKPVGNAVELKTSIIEETGTVFLYTLGIKDLKFPVTSSARTTYEIG